MSDDPGDALTRVRETPRAAAPRAERFAAGTVLAGRYRIASPLGRGGMGEVYRAEDLKLGQDVALKFLPESLAADPALLARFHNEVRVAREITHPNVCRVHDIVEWNGLHFITMEYVDGEDLASLLRRIGRLPQDKGLELAQQLCSGLASAHERGMVHRDLKPANLMLDGRGRLRITDFGLAGVAAQMTGAEAASGTPAYMAPEQATGREVSPRSDVYSLGLVLYEMFTGRPAFHGDTRAALLRAHLEETPSAPSSQVPEIAPALERVILRCLEKDPRNRPASAAAVAASLPGQDPLAAAIAAGITPSPEMVAAAGEVGALSPAAALRWLGVSLAFAVLAYAMILQLEPNLVQRTPMGLSPDALELRARDSLRRLGVAAAPYSARSFDYDADVLRHIVHHETGASRWDNLQTGQPAAVYFWYRESAEPLFATTPLGAVNERNPEPVARGSVLTRLDTTGRLIFLQRMALRDVLPFLAKREPDWASLFNEAGLELKRFRRIEPLFVPPVFADNRGSWIGPYASRREVRVRIDAAALHGRPVYFEIVGPWSQQGSRSLGFRGFELMMVSMLAGGVLLARRNLRLGRGDRRGALRLATFSFALVMIQWLFLANHVADALLEWSLFQRGAARALFWSGTLWVFYVALEPYVRRFWPEAVVSWSRLLAGRVRDPLVARDVLIGLAAGYASIVLAGLALVSPATFGSAAVRLSSAAELDALAGLRQLLAALCGAARLALQVAFLYVTLLLLLRMLLRRQVLVFSVFVLLTTSATWGIFDQWLGGTYPLDVPAIAGMTVIHYFLVTRVGLVGTIAALVPAGLGLSFPVVGGDWNAWYASSLLLPIVVQAALLSYSFFTSLGGRPVFSDEALR